MATFRAAALSPRSQLPDPWSPPEVVEDIVVADSLSIRRAGVASVAPTGEEVTGAAADMAVSPLARAHYELLERAAVVDAMQHCALPRALLDGDGHAMGIGAYREFAGERDSQAGWSHSRSNGVALHADWPTAALRARCELGERDRLLRSWAGQVRPERLALDASAFPILAAPTYAFRAAHFPEPEDERFSADLRVVALVGFPRDPLAPLVFGFAGRPSLSDALSAAALEATQLLAFLWGEPVVQQCGKVVADPLFHMDYFQVAEHRDLLHGWLDGDHLRYARYESAAPARTSGLRYVDLTPDWLAGGLRVAKAVCAGAMGLTFGASPALSHLPAPLRVHPIA